MTIHRILLLKICIGFGTWASAQAYTTAVGLRLAAAPGISMQQRIAAKYSVEGTIQSGIFNRQTSISALAQRHYPVLGKGMNFYLGAGPQWTSYALKNSNKENQPKRLQTLGIAALAGLELRIQKTLLSFDYRPALRFGGPQVLDAEAALSLRYILIKQPGKKKKSSNKAERKGWPWGKK